MRRRDRPIRLPPRRPARAASRPHLDEREPRRRLPLPTALLEDAESAARDRVCRLARRARAAARPDRLRQAGLATPLAARHHSTPVSPRTEASPISGLCEPRSATASPGKAPSPERTDRLRPSLPIVTGGFAALSRLCALVYYPESMFMYLRGTQPEAQVRAFSPGSPCFHTGPSLITGPHT